jgi:alkylhydroperoxidase family enzyme
MACFEDSTAFNDKERLVLRLAVALTKTPASVSDDLFANLGREFSEPQLVELATAIAWENYRARFNRTLITAEGFSEGAFCPLPEHP